MTPLSTVLAMRNLGALLVDAEPSEARSLYAVALAQLEAHELDPAIRPGLANALGYALICLGDLPAAREALGRAERDAVAHRRMRIVLYARSTARSRTSSRAAPSTRGRRWPTSSEPPLPPTCRTWPRGRACGSPGSTSGRER